MDKGCGRVSNTNKREGTCPICSHTEAPICLSHVSHSPAMLHVERLIHAAGDLDLYVLVLSVFRHRHLVPLRHLKPAQSRVTSGQIRQLRSGQVSVQTVSARIDVRLARYELKKTAEVVLFWDPVRPVGSLDSQNATCLI